MAVCGIDLGNQSAVIAQAGRGGVDIILNETSKRLTPVLVSFVGSERYLGEAAVTQVRTNMANTISHIKRIIGRKFSEADIATEQDEFVNYKLVRLEDDEIGIEVTYDGETRVFSPTQALAMFFTKMKETIALKNPTVVAPEVVISVPAYHTDAQRAAVKDAAAIAGLDCLRLLNEGTAAALSYGIYKSARREFPEGAETKVMFLDMGDAHFTATIAAFTNSSLRVLSTESDATVGGRNIDYVLAKSFAEEFQATTRLNPWTNRKTRIKLLAAAEKAKTAITPFGVNTTRVSVECLMEERDFNTTLTVEKMEELMAPMMARMQATMRRAMEKAAVKSIADLMAAELVGGSMRVRVVKRKAAEVLGLTINEETGHGLSTSMNLDECISRGCALACAQMSPSFRVKAFEVVDTITYPIRVSWEAATDAAAVAGSGSGGGEPMALDEEDREGGAAAGGAGGGSSSNGAAGSVLLFKAGDTTPLTRRVTFKRTKGFELTVEYDESATPLLPAGAPRALKRYFVDVPDGFVGEGEAPPKVRVDFRHDVDGIITLVRAEVIKELRDAEVAAPVEPAAAAAAGAPAAGDVKMDGSGAADTTTAGAAAAASDAAAAGAGDAPKKKKTKRTESTVSVVFTCGGLSFDAMSAAVTSEARMKRQDDDIHATHDMRNSLEAYIYATRDAIYGELSDFGSEDAKAALSAALEEAESWLYDNMEADRATFEGKLSALRALGDPLTRRKWEEENRAAAGTALMTAVNEYRSIINNRDGKHGHLSDSDRDTMRAACSEAEDWYRGKQSEQAALTRTDDPVLKVAEIEAKRTSLVRELKPIANKPVPPPAAAPVPAPAPAASAPAPAPAGAGAGAAAPAAADASASDAPAAGGGTPMDLDGATAAGDAAAEPAEPAATGAASNPFE